MSGKCLARWIQMAHYALTQQQGASLDTSWSNFTTEWAQEHSGAWDVLCGNTSVIIPPFLTLQRFIWGQQFVPVRGYKIDRELIFGEQWHGLLNSALFTPDSSTRKISSPRPELSTDTAQSEPLSGLCHMSTAQRPLTLRTTQSLSEQRCLISETLHLKKGPNGAQRQHSGNPFLPNLHSNIAPNWQGNKNKTLMNGFFIFYSLLACDVRHWPLVSWPAILFGWTRR